MADVSTQFPTIIVKLNESVLKEVLITQPHFTIGRKPDNDLVIDNAAVSSHHARLIKVQGVYFLEDLKSTNGTFVNDNRVERHQLQDTDVMAIGKHRLIFRDEVTARGTAPSSELGDADKTMIIKHHNGQATPQVAQKLGILQIISGRTDHQEYQLTNKLTIVGSQDNAAVKLGGWFAPKIAAMIGRRGSGYFVSASEQARKVQVNQQVVTGQADLKDGDMLEVAGVKMYFYLKEAGKG